MILCDTNILIEFYKGNLAIVDELHQVGQAELGVSVITTGELFFGARDRVELAKIQKHLSLITDVTHQAVKKPGKICVGTKNA